MVGYSPKDGITELKPGFKEGYMKGEYQIACKGSKLPVAEIDKSKKYLYIDDVKLIDEVYKMLVRVDDLVATLRLVLVWENFGAFGEVAGVELIKEEGRTEPAQGRVPAYYAKSLYGAHILNKRPIRGQWMQLDNKWACLVDTTQKVNGMDFFCFVDIFVNYSVDNADRVVLDLRKYTCNYALSPIGKKLSLLPSINSHTRAEFRTINGELAALNLRDTGMADKCKYIFDCKFKNFNEIHLENAYMVHASGFHGDGGGIVFLGGSHFVSDTFCDTEIVFLNDCMLAYVAFIGCKVTFMGNVLGTGVEVNSSELIFNKGCLLEKCESRDWEIGIGDGKV